MGIWAFDWIGWGNGLMEAKFVGEEQVAVNNHASSPLLSFRPRSDANSRSNAGYPAHRASIMNSVT